MAVLQDDMYPRVQLKLDDVNGESYTENLGYATFNVYDSSKSNELNELNNGLNQVAALMNATLISKKVICEFELENE